MPPAPTNEAVEVSQPVSVSRRQDQFTGDYLRDDMAVFEVNYLFGFFVLSVAELALD